MLDKKLLDRIKDNDVTLEELILTGIPLEEKDVFELSIALEKNTKIKYIQLRDCALDDKKLELLCAGIKKSKIPLINLDIQEKQSKITGKGRTLVVETLQIVQKRFEENKGINLMRLQQLVATTFEKAVVPNTQDLVLVIGNTGSGKSTSINYLLGCQMESVRLPSGKSVITVAKTSKEYARIGHTATSQTAFPEAFLIPSASLAYCDCSGFGDNRGTEQGICTAIGTQVAIQSSHNVKAIMVVINFNAIKTDRAAPFRSLVATLGNFFENVDELRQSLHFVFTNVPKFDQVTGQTINKAEAKKQIQDAIIELIQHAHNTFEQDSLKSIEELRVLQLFAGGCNRYEVESKVIEANIKNGIFYFVQAPDSKEGVKISSIVYRDKLNKVTSLKLQPAHLEELAKIFKDDAINVGNVAAELCGQKQQFSVCEYLTSLVKEQLFNTEHSIMVIDPLDHGESRAEIQSWLKAREKQVIPKTAFRFAEHDTTRNEFNKIMFKIAEDGIRILGHMFDTPLEVKADSTKLEQEKKTCRELQEGLLELSIDKGPKAEEIQHERKIKELQDLQRTIILAKEQEKKDAISKKQEQEQIIAALDHDGPVFYWEKYNVLRADRHVQREKYGDSGPPRWQSKFRDRVSYSAKEDGFTYLDVNVPVLEPVVLSCDHGGFFDGNLSGDGKLYTVKFRTPGDSDVECHVRVVINAKSKDKHRNEIEIAKKNRDLQTETIKAAEKQIEQCEENIREYDRQLSLYKEGKLKANAELKKVLQADFEKEIASVTARIKDLEKTLHEKTIAHEHAKEEFVGYKLTLLSELPTQALTDRMFYLVLNPDVNKSQIVYKDGQGETIRKLAVELFGLLPLLQGQTKASLEKDGLLRQHVNKILRVNIYPSKEDLFNMLVKLSQILTFDSVLIKQFLDKYKQCFAIPQAEELPKPLLFVPPHKPLPKPMAAAGVPSQASDQKAEQKFKMK